MFSVGIDLGGTNIATALVSPEGKILHKVSIPTPRDTSPELPQKVAEAIAQSIFLALKEGNHTLVQAKYIGIAAPGTIDPSTQTIGFWSNLNFNNVPLGQLVTESLKKQEKIVPSIYLENDANAAALGEFYGGAGKNANSIIAITLGTGVGGGAVLNGKLYTGFNYAGLEVGHFVLQVGGKPCSCGRSGCFEAYSSATAFISQTKEAMEQDKDSIMWKLAEGKLEKVNGKTAFDAAQQGDTTAQAVVEQYLFYLASGISSLINLFQPEILCIGGGIAGQKDKLLQPLLALIDQQDYARNHSKRCKVVLAELGNDAGLVGAAFLPDFQTLN